MKIPEGMTEEQVMAQFKIVIDRIAPRYTFYGWVVDDIKQEAYIECMEALERYDGKRPLENFLSYNLANRLKNVIRKHHFKTTDKDDKKRVLMPGQLSNEEAMRYYEEDMDQNIDTSDMISVIDKHLPSTYRENYLKMVNDIHIDKKQKDELIEVIKTIVEEYGYE